MKLGQSKKLFRKSRRIWENTDREKMQRNILVEWQNCRRGKKKNDVW